MYAPTQYLLKGYHKFIPWIQPSLLGSKNRNFGGVPDDFLVFVRKFSKKKIFKVTKWELESFIYVMGKEL